MKYSSMSSGARSTVKVSLILLCLLVSNALVFAQQPKDSQAAQGPKPTTSEKATATPKAASTPETKINAETEAELVKADERFVNAIENRDAKTLDELLHPQFADSFEGGESAVSRRGFIRRLNEGRLPAYRVEKERALIRSGDSFTVEGLAKDMSRDGWESRAEEWVHVRRLWEKQGDRWITTAQIVTPAAEGESDKQKTEEKH